MCRDVRKNLKIKKNQTKRLSNVAMDVIVASNSEGVEYIKPTVIDSPGAASPVEESKMDVIESPDKEPSTQPVATQKSLTKARRSSIKPTNKIEEVVLSPAIVTKIEFNRGRIASLIDELVATEKYAHRQQL
jgi:hypothetical protein